MFTIRDTPDTYDSIPRGPMRACVGKVPDRKHETFTEEQLRKIAILQRSAREHFSNDDIYQAMWFFQAFSNCKGINFIKQLIGGHRRSWIGSVLQCAQPLLNTDEYKRLEHLFSRILRGADCGFNMSIGDAGFAQEGLPFVADNDPDLRFGRWSPEECSTAVLLLSKIMASSPTFARPPGPIGIAPDFSEWHDWTRSNILSLLKMRDLDYSDCNMLSFIG
jgi:hypothetical protein